MSLELIHGPAGSGKTSFAIKEFLEAVDSGGSALFIAPSLPDARHFQRRILGQRPVLAGGDLATFNQVFKSLFEPDGLRVITPLERLAVLREAIRRSHPARVLADSCLYEGFVAHLAELISELEALEISPARLGGAMKEWAGGDKWRRGLNQEFFRIHEEYRMLLADIGAVSSESAQRMAAMSLSGAPGKLKADLVVIDGFRDFTPAEKIFVEAVGSSDKRLLVTLPYEEGNPAYVSTGMVYASLVPAARTRKLRRADSGRHPALDHLSGHLFRQGAPQAPAEGAVAIMETAAVRGQGERVAAEILKLWRSGVALDDIAVVTRSHGADSIAIADACRDFGIPIEVGAPIPLASTPVGLTALSALDLLAATISNSSDLSILTYLRSPLAGTPAGQIDSFERRLRKTASRDAAAARNLWEKTAGRELSEIDRMKGALPQGLSGLGTELSQWMRELLGSARFAEYGLEDLSLDVLALKVLVAVCESMGALEDSLSALMEGRESPEGAARSAGEAINLFKSAIRQAEVRPPSGITRGCVRLLDPHRMLNQRFDVVIICGLLEGQFPSAKRENVFINDSDRLWLRDHDRLKLDTHQKWLEEERFLFYRTLTRARRKVYLCYPGCDDEGKPTINSLLVDDVLDLFTPDSVERITRGIGEPAFSPDEAPTENQALLALSLASRGQRLKIKAPGSLKQRFAECLEAGKPRDFGLSDETRNQFRALETFHVTELEEYLRCPCLYFIRKIVQARPLEEDTYALERGIAVHSILKEFFQVLGRAAVFLPDAQQEQVVEARQIMDQIVEDQFANSTDDLRSLVMKNHIKHHLDKLIDREVSCRPQFRPYRLEWSFGVSSNEPAARHEEQSLLSFGDVKVSGRIDRVDLIEGRAEAVVIDYKATAETNLYGQGRFEEKAVLQVPLYLLAVRNIWGLEPVGGEYYGVLSGGRRGLYLQDHAEVLGYGSEELSRSDFVDRDEFEGRIDQARERAVKAAEGIRSAEFDPRPVEDNICKRCGVRDLCRVDEPDVLPEGRGGV